MKTIELDDELNPEYIFRTIATDLLTQALSGKIDLKELAAKELENRGLDKDGKWVGFQSK